MGKKGRKRDVEVREDFKLGVQVVIDGFRNDETKRELEFPSSLDNNQRAFIHQYAASLGLKSKSRGKDFNRYLTLFKKDINSVADQIPVFQFTQSARRETQGLFQRYPVTARERQELLPRTERRRFGPNDANPARDIKPPTGKLTSVLPQIPIKRKPSDLDQFRRGLPVFAMGTSVLELVNSNRVVIIAGETGSGKTTQVPQFILDHACETGQPCRIICTQPRRISALSISQRVAAERGETVGQTVGFQIRLESRVSPKTLLTFCTNGVLLRTLMMGDAALRAVSHVIIDELHERDRYSDFLLTQLKALLPKHPHLRIILMSAALDIDLFVGYFDNCPVLEVPGKLFDVEELFLEDALKCTGYTNKKMEKYLKDKEKKAKQCAELDKWTSGQVSVSSEVGAAAAAGTIASGVSSLREGLGSCSLDVPLDAKDMPDWLVEATENAISQAWLHGSDAAFSQLLHYIMSENVSVDYAHSHTSITPLMAAAARGNMEVVEKLLSFEASVHLKTANKKTAADLAKMCNQTEVATFLEAYRQSLDDTLDDDSSLPTNGAVISSEDKELLEAYQSSFDDDNVDLELIIRLVSYICQNSVEGAILIFLPGYDEIMNLRDTLLNNERFSDTSTYRIYTLHSSMQSDDQVKVFRATPSGVRKIVLSTNIAETSITINDVVFVIDSGKVKEKTYDALTSVSMLRSTWISKASAKQRKGRAGRCQKGMCFHLCSRLRFQSLSDFQCPEILRLPLHELCLHTKLLAPVQVPIADFLAKAPQPPSSLAIRNAIQLLKSIDALDQWEDLTELGCHLADLPIEPHLGKMVLYSIVLKCLDPILTIACALAYRDPFILPKHPSQRRATLKQRKKHAANTFSDHMALLRAFQHWQRARSDGWEKVFCNRNFLSLPSLEMIVGMRTQLLGQLRASGFVRARGPGDIRDLNANSENWAVVKGALCAGMYPNILRVDKLKGTLWSMQEKKLRFHTTSVLTEEASEYKTMQQLHSIILKALPSEWLIYQEKTRLFHSTSVRCVTLVSPVTIALFCGPSCLPEEALLIPEAASLAQRRMGPNGDGDDSTSETEDDASAPMALFKMDEWLMVKMDVEAANLVVNLRQKCHTLVLRRMRTPAKPWSQADEAVLDTLVKVLSSEEQALGLQQPTGVGQRPKPMAIDNFNSPPPRSVENRFGQGGSVARNSGAIGRGRGSPQEKRNNARDFRSSPGRGSNRGWYGPNQHAAYFNNNSSNGNNYAMHQGYSGGMPSRYNQGSRNRTPGYQDDVGPPPGFDSLNSNMQQMWSTQETDDRGQQRTPPPFQQHRPNPDARPFDPGTPWCMDDEPFRPVAHSTPSFLQGPTSQFGLGNGNLGTGLDGGGGSAVWSTWQQGPEVGDMPWSNDRIGKFGGSY